MVARDSPVLALDVMGIGHLTLAFPFGDGEELRRIVREARPVRPSSSPGCVHQG